MKEFQKLVGKKLLWVGSDPKEDGDGETTYLLFEDNVGVAIDMVEAEVHELTDAKDTLAQLLSGKLEEMKSLQALEKILIEEKENGTKSDAVSADVSPDKGATKPVATEGSDSELST